MWSFSSEACVGSYFDLPFLRFLHVLRVTLRAHDAKRQIGSMGTAWARRRLDIGGGACALPRLFPPPHEFVRCTSIAPTPAAPCGSRMWTRTCASPAGFTASGT